MDFRAHARHSLQTTRRIMEGILESFKTPEDWVYQSHGKANHALWIIGHLALADNMFLSRFRPDEANKPDGYEERFWFGTEISGDASSYPPADEVLVYFRERREKLLEVLDAVSDEELAGPAPPAEERGPIAGAPNIGHLFLFAGQHEAIHLGQLTVAHRGLGNPPLFRP